LKKQSKKVYQTHSKNANAISEAIWNRSLEESESGPDQLEEADQRKRFQESQGNGGT
jgi:hypothetical protein